MASAMGMETTVKEAVADPVAVQPQGQVEEASISTPFLL